LAFPRSEAATPPSLAVQQHQSSGAKATVLTAKLANPKGYGRMIRNSEGKLIAIREQVDCTEAEAKVNEVNSGTYLFDTQSLFSALKNLNSNNKQGEFYLTDTLSAILSAGGSIESSLLADSNEMLGINDRLAASEVETLLQRRINESWMLRGVTMREPQSIWIDVRTQLAPDVTIERGCTLINTKVGEGTHLKPGCYIEDSVIGEQCVLGPYAHLRPGTVLKKKVKIGNFVELKKATMDEGSKASHLSYIGDAEVGKEVNIGCGFITCNYNGITKEKTIIEDNVFVGSDSQTVAPVTIGKGSYVASGTTVTKNVPPDSLVISRGRQTVRPGYAKRFQKK
jgi:bifunctional UDP-N-acetylglucosamine pyrophosphorylase/glucosamine-1-phosphate N-acetyltransferase